MIDDLVTHGVQEPYRMFTSRAEYRLLLRADNADQRLTEKGYKFGIVNKTRYKNWKSKENELYETNRKLKNFIISPARLKKLGVSPPRDGKKQTAIDLLRNKDFNLVDLEKIYPEIKKINKSILKQINIDALYSGYLKRQESDIKSFKKDEKLRIPKDINFKEVGGLSNEAIEKLSLIKPETISQASRISGITPVAIVSILRHIKRTAA